MLKLFHNHITNQNYATHTLEIIILFSSQFSFCVRWRSQKKEIEEIEEITIEKISVAKQLVS